MIRAEVEATTSSRDFWDELSKNRGPRVTAQGVLRRPLDDFQEARELSRLMIIDPFGDRLQAAAPLLRPVQGTQIPAHGAACVLDAQVLNHRDRGIDPSALLVNVQLWCPNVPISPQHQPLQQVFHVSTQRQGGEDAPELWDCGWQQQTFPISAVAQAWATHLMGRALSSEEQQAICVSAALADYGREDGDRASGIQMLLDELAHHAAAIGLSHHL